jgi:hypothetical protein
MCSETPIERKSSAGALEVRWTGFPYSTLLRFSATFKILHKIRLTNRDATSGFYCSSCLIYFHVCIFRFQQRNRWPKLYRVLTLVDVARTPDFPRSHAIQECKPWDRSGIHVFSNEIKRKNVRNATSTVIMSSLSVSNSLYSRRPNITQRLS